MNGHRQSGGHWNVAFGLVTRSSGSLGSSACVPGSGDGSPKEILLIISNTSTKQWRSGCLGYATWRRGRADVGRPPQFLRLSCSSSQDTFAARGYLFTIAQSRYKPSKNSERILTVLAR